MSRWFVWIAALALLLAAVSWAEESKPSKEWEAPVAQVPMAVQGTVSAVDPQERTFTVTQPPRHRQPPQTTVVGVNRDTKYVLNEAVVPKLLALGDRVRVEAQRPKPYGVTIWAEGEVAGLDPLVVEVSPEVKVTLLSGAEVVLVRTKEMRFEDLQKGMEVQVIAYRGTDPAVAKSIETFVIAPGAATLGGSASVAPESTAP
jgi:hypothetical protein